MTEDNIRALILRKATRFARSERSTGVTAWGAANDIKSGHLSEFMNSKRAPTTAILNALGLEWRICRKRKQV